MKRVWKRRLARLDAKCPQPFKPCDFFLINVGEDEMDAWRRQRGDTPYPDENLVHMIKVQFVNPDTPGYAPHPLVIT